MMIIGRGIRSLALVTCAGVVLVGCSSGGDKATCDDLVDTINSGAHSITVAADDPATAGDELRALADDLRTATEGASDAITSAADDLANLYDAMADGFESGDVSDLSGLEAAATALEEACS